MNHNLNNVRIIIETQIEFLVVNAPMEVLFFFLSFDEETKK